VRLLRETGSELTAQFSCHRLKENQHHKTTSEADEPLPLRSSCDRRQKVNDANNDAKQEYQNTMNDWLRAFHGGTAAFPISEIAVKVGLALSLGLLIGFEREWSNKDTGVRTFAMTALLGLLGSLLGSPALLLAGVSVLILIIFANLRGLQTARKLEATTSVALMIVFLLGVLVGNGHLFTPVACSILVAMLLSLKPQFRAFAGGLTAQEVRSGIMLALVGFVIWPLLPNRFVDPWKLFQPRQAWITVIVVACLGFFNYVLLRVSGPKGIYITAILGGLVNSTASVAELASTLSATGLASLAVPVVLLTSVAMFLRNVLILAIFAVNAVRTAALPILAMGSVAAYWIYRDHRKAEKLGDEVSLKLGSPVSLKRVFNFALLFLIVQVLATLGQRLLGNTGFEIVSTLGGLFSSASTTAASATMVMHGKVTAAEAGVATVLTSIASSLVDLPIVYRQIKDKSVVRQLTVSSLLQVAAGIAVLIVQFRLTRIH
jgi:uncharacterized membrane protein (DUF4010 family)